MTKLGNRTHHESTQEEIKVFEYVCSGNFRVVPPYHYEFGSSIKARWIGRSLVEVFAQEFPHFDDSTSYFEDAMRKGRLRVNDKVADVSYRCSDGDVITHFVHRHEPPVTSQPVSIVGMTDDLIAVDKPGSLPVHSGGRFRRNSLVAVLAKEHGLFDLHTVHRLDRLTSGLLLLGRNAAAAERMRQEFESGGVQKRYLARVVGAFPAELRVDQPLRVGNAREALVEVHPEGKPSVTVMRRLVYSEADDESLVLCMPETGRTHQIRVHLQWAGHAIVDDPLYGPLAVPDTAAAAAAAGEDAAAGSKRAGDDGGMPLTTKMRRGAGEAAAREDEALNLAARGWEDPDCPHCRRAKEEGCRGYYVAVKRKFDDSNALSICLHALTNEGPGWAFAAGLPGWATDMAPAAALVAAIPGYQVPLPRNASPPEEARLQQEGGGCADDAAE